MRVVFGCLCATAIGCAADAVPIEQPAQPFVATAGDLDVEDAFIELVFAVGGAARTVVRMDAHAPDGAIAPAMSFPGAPGGGSLTTTGVATHQSGADESFNLAVALDHYRQPGHTELSTADPGALTLTLTAIPDGQHDLHGDLEGSFHGRLHADSGPVGDFDVSLTLSGLLYVRADGTHDVEQCTVAGTLDAAAYGTTYENSYHPF